MFHFLATGEAEGIFTRGIVAAGDEGVDEELAFLFFESANTASS